MEWVEGAGSLIARCIVCRCDIFEGQTHEVWEGGYYCQRHSVPHLRDRAKQFAELLKEREEAPKAF